MNRRRFFLDRSPGESRAVVTLDGRPERLLIARDADLAVQAYGARAVARVRAIDRNPAIAVLDLGEGPDATLNLEPQIVRISEGFFVEVEVRAEAREGKGGRARWLGHAEGPARLLAPGPNLEAKLESLSNTATTLSASLMVGAWEGREPMCLSTASSCDACVTEIPVQ